MFYPVYNKPETTANYYDIVTFYQYLKDKMSQTEVTN